MPSPTPPQCVCKFSAKTAVPNQPGLFEYTYRCHWERGMGGGSYIDTNTYTVSVECTNDDAKALQMAKEQCPYEAKPQK